MSGNANTAAASVTGTWPANSPSGLTQTIPSYLFIEYNDDEDLQAFVTAYNTMAQQYIDSFNQLLLPIYTSPTINGPLLDWVGLGLYGIARPLLPSLGPKITIGAVNTYANNVLAINRTKINSPSTFFTTTDDIYRRIITWHFLKGDGKVFNIRWLKRRVERFLRGVNGINYDVDQTYEVSVKLAGNNQVTIFLGGTTMKIITGFINTRLPMFNTINSTAVNTMTVKTNSSAAPPFSDVFKSGVDSGVLELPFQFQYTVII
jgi:hypothetical protein